MKQRIIVLGGTGYLGAPIALALARRGHDVRAVGRQDVDIRKPETLGPALEGADGVVHAALDASPDADEIDRRLLEWMVPRLAKTGARLVYTSGVWVLGSTGGDVADEQTVPNPAALVAWRPEAERRVAEADGWVIRPGIVYGGCGGITAMMFASAESEGATRIVGDGNNHWALVHREDLGELYARVLEQAPAERVFHATDGSTFTVAQIARALSHAGGAGGRVVSAPLPEARASLGDFADALALDQRVSSACAHRAVGWSASHRSLVAESEDLWRQWKEARARSPERKAS
jgi:nucleoside-diphosphate-sugar epimerase